RFSLVRRSSVYPANDIQVRMDDVPLGTVLNTSQPDDTWRTFTVAYNCTNAGPHSLAFVGMRGGADNASALDDVQIGGATTFEVPSAPPASGLRTATLSTANNAPDENPYIISLPGTGLATTPPTPPQIDARSLTRLGNGAIQFTFTDTNYA